MTILNDSLSLQRGRLMVESCDATLLAHEFGTPLFVISETHLRQNLRRYKAAFETHWTAGPVRIMPAFKACPLLAVRRVLSAEGCGCDVFGPGELEGALRGGVDPADISVNGSIKDRAIIRRAIDIGARIVLDSPRELELCREEAAALGSVARVMFRLKPFMDRLTVTSDFLPGAEIREMTQLIKYGIPTSELLPLGPQALASAYIDPVGVHVHMGRHSSQTEVWRHWVRHCVMLTRRLSEAMHGWIPRVIDLGGGFPSASDRDTDVALQGGENPGPGGYAEAIARELQDALVAEGLHADGITIEIEPGRGIHSDTGIHLTTVRNLKEERENRPRRWVELDTSEVFLGVPGLNDTPPFDYLFANRADDATTGQADLVGVTCNAELLFKQVAVPDLAPGDVVALLNTGAYIEPMAANFNSLPRPGTVLVCGDRAELIKRHETINDVFGRDILPPRLRGEDTGP